MRFLKRFTIAVIVVAILALAGELVLRQVIQSRIADEVRSSMQLADDHTVNVTLGGSALLHAAQGGVGDVTLHVPDVQILEGVAVDASAHASFAPFDTKNGELRGGIGSLTVPSSELDALVSQITQGFAETATVNQGNLRVERTLDVLGQEMPVSVTLGLSIADGDILVTPVDLQAGGLSIDAEALRSFAPGFAETVADGHAVCVRDRLPQGITLKSLAVEDSGAVTLDADLDPEILSNPAQLELGTCS